MNVDVASSLSKSPAKSCDDKETLVEAAFADEEDSTSTFKTTTATSGSQLC
jgi:hypothetical protein